MRCVVLCGAGRAFAAGADVAGLRALSAGRGARRASAARRWAAAALAARCRSIAAVHGWCLGGGCELALTCDIVLAAEDARFGLPETGLGPDPGRGRYAAAAARRRSLARARDDPRRAHAVGARGAAARHLLARRRARGARARGARARRAHRRAARARPCGSRARPCERAFESPLETGLERGAPSVRAAPSRATTPARAWTPSSRAARPIWSRRRMTDEPTHRVERDGAVATVTLDRPDALNAQTRASRRALIARPARAVGRRRRALRRADGRGPRVLRGPGSARAGRARRTSTRRSARPTSRSSRRSSGMPKPVVAAINGAGRGRGPLVRAGLRPALHGRGRRADDGVLEHRRSCPTAAAPGCCRASSATRGRSSSPRRAAACDAAEALALGLVQRVLPRDELLAAAHATGRASSRRGRRWRSAGRSACCAPPSRARWRT